VITKYQILKLYAMMRMFKMFCYHLQYDQKNHKKRRIYVAKNEKKWLTKLYIKLLTVIAEK
jgi:hypothetical protein